MLMFNEELRLEAKNELGGRDLDGDHRDRTKDWEGAAACQNFVRYSYRRTG
jgi:hypothetical protein